MILPNVDAAAQEGGSAGKWYQRHPTTLPKLSCQGLIGGLGTLNSVPRLPRRPFGPILSVEGQEPKHRAEWDDITNPCDGSLLVNRSSASWQTGGGQMEY